ncbi:MAG: ABC transporter ATP-binding protein [Actinobacteria bacterium]|nr:ABC transporter ATP-binding protein [Actinomycetota bacterium]
MGVRDDARVIEVEGLSKRFGKTQAVAGLSFRVEPGTITGFLGPNGAGKSTTLRSVLGLVHPDAGSATVLGVPYRQLDRPLHRVGAVLEASEVHPGRSGRNHLRVQAAAAGLPDSRIDEVLALVELSAAGKKRVKGYSLGMRQRLGLATALLGDPEVLVLDEPANGLDPAGIRWLRDLLRSLAAEGRTILVSSHVLSEVAQTADRVVIVHRGKLIQQATVAEVIAGAQGATRVRSPEAQRLRDLVAAAGATVTEIGEGTLAADIPPERIGEIAAANGIVLHELTVESATLEEVFLELTGGETTQ